MLDMVLPIVLPLTISNAKVMKTITVEKVIGVTTANFKVLINGRKLLIPVSQIHGIYGNKLTFHNKKDAQAIFRMV